MRARFRPLHLIAALLLAVHFGLAVASKRNESTTSDEIAHLTAGVSYWKFNDYRLQPENGNLPQRWLALPAVLQGATFPTLAGDEYWRTSDVWVLGHKFFYETGEDHFPRLMAARAMIALFSVGVGILVLAWSRLLFGDAAGLFSLALFAFSPTFLAHGALATSDVCMAFFLLASVGAWWRHLQDGKRRTAALSLLCFGLACVAKYSAVLLIPIFGLTGVALALSSAPLRIAGHESTRRRAKLVALAITAAAHVAAAGFVIWMFFGFRYSAFNPAEPGALQFIRRWDLIDATIGAQGRLVDLLAAVHALPEAFLYGYAYVLDSMVSRAAFLNGNYSFSGWWSFFPWTFALKSTVATLMAVGTTLVVCLQRWSRRPGSCRSDLWRVLPLLVFFVVYWGFSLTSRLNIGQRHILPTYPILFIGAGAIVAAAKTRRSLLTLIAAICVTWQVSAAIRIYPHYLAYFNEIAGGPVNGYRHLVDSSLDWGQDLPGLNQWLDKRSASSAPVYLSYFGTGEPSYYHLTARRIAMINGFKFREPLARLEPGTYCISVTCLQQVYNPYRGPWTVEKEREYQELRRLEPAFFDYAEHPEHQVNWEKDIPRGDWDRVQKRYDSLRFARLCQLLRLHAPQAQIGYSINIYQLNQADIDAVTGPLDGLVKAMEQAASAR